MLVGILGAFGIWNAPAILAQEPSMELLAGASVRLSADQPSFGSTGDVTLHVTITNRNGYPIRMLKWLTPLDGVEGPLFVVRRDGEPVAYLGKLVKRVPPTEADYLTFAPGDSLTCDVDLSLYYDLSVSGTYAVEYNVAPSESYAAGGGWRQKSADRVVSNTLELFIEGRAKAMLQNVVPNAVSGTTSFVSCSASRQTDLINARAASSTYANNAVAFFSAGTSGPRYATWFGAYEASRYSTVSGHFTAIRNAVDTASPMTFNCTCTDPDVYAYVYPNSPYIIYLCGAFWSVPVTGTDSRAGTLIHETSHFTIVAGTVDHVYGQSAAAALAISSPSQAIQNADNHEYFAENNPPLAEYTNHLSISDVSVAEGHSGTTNATFTVSLSKASSGTVSVAYQTANGTATAVTNATTPVANSASLAIPSSGAATPYPSSITVPAGLGSLQKVTATLAGFSHTSPADVDVLLVGPAGQSVVLMSDVGSSIGATNLTFVFDDSGPALGTGALASGTYRPTNVSTGDSWPSPAPAGPYGTALSAFNGRDPAGVWTLYVVDDTASYAGSISGGWSLTLTTPGQTGDYTSASGTLIIAPGATSGSVTVAVRGDTAVEPNETFFVNLSSASNATIGDGQGIGTIVNDDGTRGDFTGDLKSDILWRHATRGEVWLWPMDGAARVTETRVETVPDTGYQIVGTGDFNGDGMTDILWHHATRGEVWIWPMNGTTRLAETRVGTVPDTGYQIVGTGDFNGDGMADILWHHAMRGEVWVWLMHGTTMVSETKVATVPDVEYRIVGTGDFNGDGRADILWHHATRGEVWVWLMNGATRISETRVETVPDTGYRIVGVADYTGDGRADILWHHATRGEVWIWPMNGTTRVTETRVGTVPDTGYQIVGTGDYNGDYKADILWHHATRGEVWVWPMNGTTMMSETKVATVPDVGYQIVK